MRAWVTVGLLAWCGSLLVSEPVFGEPRSERYEVPKHVVDFDGEARSGTFNATLARACGPPQRLSERLLSRLYFYAFVTIDDPELLSHFLEFYEGLGIRFNESGRVRLFVNPGFNKSSAKDRLVHRLLVHKCGASYPENVRVSRTFSSDIKRDFANEFLTELPKDALLMFPDLDEFFDTPPEVIEAAVDAFGGFVLGHMIDRVAADWTLEHMDRKKSIWKQYPRRCAATHERFHASNNKWIVVPNRVDKG